MSNLFPQPASDADIYPSPTRTNQLRACNHWPPALPFSRACLSRELSPPTCELLIASSVAVEHMEANHSMAWTVIHTS